MQSFEQLIDKHKGRDFLIACTGLNTGVYIDQIRAFIKKNKPVVIGMNSIRKLITPDYHLFTNNSRIVDYGNEVSSQSTLLIGSHVKPENIPDRDYTLIKYTDRNKQEKMDYRDGVIYGYYRVSGLLAVMMAHLMGARKTYITGMDGYSHTCKVNNGYVHFHKDDRDNISNNKSPELWWDRYDTIMVKVAKRLRNYGIDFSIITPTVFEEFYEDTLCLSK